MKIGPADSGGRPQGLDDKERRKNDVTPRETPGTDSADNAERSQEARLPEEKTLQDTGDTDNVAPTDEFGGADEAAEIENRADKIEQARQRMESGYYNSPEVKEEIARRITDDFAG